LLQDLEALLEDERRASEEARQAAVIVERKRIALQAEVEELRSVIETVGGICLMFNDVSGMGQNITKTRLQLIKMALEIISRPCCFLMAFYLHT
jgi:hypothetical protein